MGGAINAFTIFAYVAKLEYADKAIIGPAYIGIISMILVIALAGIVCLKKTRTEKAANNR